MSKDITQVNSIHIPTGYTLFRIEQDSLVQLSLREGNVTADEPSREVANIDIWKPFGQAHGSEVNWSAHGSTDSDFARLYSHLLKLAADIADELDRELAAEEILAAARKEN